MTDSNGEAKAEKRERDEDHAAAAGDGAEVPVTKKSKAEESPERAAKDAPPAETISTADSNKDGEEHIPGAVQDKKVEEPSLSKEDAEAEMTKMIEFYFGDSNYSWDRFMQSKAGKMGEGMMEVAVLLTFNKLKVIAKRAGLSEEEAKALVAKIADSSPSLRVSEDKKEIGRAKPMTDEDSISRMERTIQAKGFRKDAGITIEDVEKLFAQEGKTTYVKICRAGGKKITSVFVEMDTKANADKAIEKSEEYSYEDEPISVRRATVQHNKDAKGAKDENGDAESAEPAEPEFEPGKIVHVSGIPKSGVSRESLKDALSSYGTVKYVDFSFGDTEAWMRMNEAAEAAEAVAALKEDGVKLGDIEQKGVITLVDGEAETSYYVKLEKMKAERNRSGSRGRGRGKGRGRGRGKGRRD